MTDVLLSPAAATDAAAVARLHAESWRSAYAAVLPEDYVANRLLEDRMRAWRERLADASPRTFTLLARRGGELAGFVHVALDDEPAWGARLANLHVRPDLKRLGIGARLFTAAREWIATVEPAWRMHLWVLEQNLAARRFYERHGGRAVEQQQIELISGVWLPEVRYVWDSMSSSFRPPGVSR